MRVHFRNILLSGHLHVAPQTENVGGEGGQPGPGERSTVARDNLPYDTPSLLHTVVSVLGGPRFDLGNEAGNLKPVRPTVKPLRHMFY